MKKGVCIVVVFFMLLVIGSWHLSKSREYQLFGELISRVDTTEKVVALTFDDGPWGEEYTAEVIAALNELDVKGTFFLNGLGIEQNFNSAKDLSVAGHQIGNHSYNHKRMVFMGLEEVEFEVDKTTDLIREIGYKGDVYFRPPYGKKFVTLPFHLKRKGMTSITWDVEPETFPDVSLSSESIANYVIASVKPGSIVLLHVLGSKNQTSRDSIPLIVNGLREKGYRFVTVSNLFSINIEGLISSASNN